MKYPYISLALLTFIISGCAATTVTPVARNQFVLATSAAPVCGRTGAAKVAAKMAAVETLKRGYQRFIILGESSQNNVSVIQTGPTYATTTGYANTYGNTTYGNARTTFGGNQTIFTGSNDADLNVLMLNPGERSFNDGLDAKSELGPNWQELMAKGVQTCAE